MRKVFGKGFGFGAATSVPPDVYFTYPDDEVVAYDTEELGMCLYANFFSNSDITPAAYYYAGTHKRIYFRFFEGLKDGANVTRSGKESKNWISYYDTDRKTFGPRYSMPCDYPTSTDYHNQGAMIVANDGRIIYVQEELTGGNHNSPLDIYRSDSAEDISAFTLVVEIAGEFAYPMLFKLANGTLFIVVRQRVGGEERYLYILRSTDNGANWTGLTGISNTPTAVIDLNLSGWFLYKYLVYAPESEGINLAVVSHQGVGSFGRRLFFLHSDDGRNWENVREYQSAGNGYTRDVVTSGVLTDALLQTNYMVGSIPESTTNGLGSRFGSLNALDKMPIMSYWIYDTTNANKDNITNWYVCTYNYFEDAWYSTDVLPILSKTRGFDAEYLSNYYNQIYSYGNGTLDMMVCNIEKDNNIIHTNPPVTSGTLIGGIYYRVLTTETNHFGANVVAGEVIRSVGTETCDANNTVRPVKLIFEVFRSYDYGQTWTPIRTIDKWLTEGAQGNVAMLHNIYDSPNAPTVFFTVMRTETGSVVDYCDIVFVPAKKLPYTTLHPAANPPGAAPPAAPTVSTAVVGSIMATTATAGGNVTDDGGAAVTARGVCYSSTVVNPTLDDSFTTNGSGEGAFSSPLSGLNEADLYYVRAYATNSEGTSYGTVETFTTETAVLATVTTTAPSNINDTNATGGGNVTHDGFAAVTDRGVCWNTSGTPTTADSHTHDGSGEGSFVSTLSGLTASTNYHVRAYAVNSEGTSYGAEEDFTTAAENTGSTYGYIAGGKTGSSYEVSAERITFSTGVYAANTVSNLSLARGFVSGVSDTVNYGYFCGGHTGAHTATTDRITFSTGATAANTGSNLSQSRSYTTGVSDGYTYGYVLGGYPGPGNGVATADRITFSTSATAANTASNLSDVRRNCAGISDNITYGYVIAGIAAALTAIADRITFSTSVTAANTTSNASQARHAVCGISDQTTYGYVFGGTTVSSGTEVVTADRIVFSTGATSANTTSNLSQGRAYIVGLSDGITYGYISGGVTGSTPTNVATTDRITFSTGATAANTTSNLTAVRQGHGGVSDKSV